MPSEAIIVLGGATEEDMLPVRAKLRVEKGVELYKAGKAPIIVMSGWDTMHADREPDKSEAQCMKEYAVELGVEPSSVELEERSKDTFGNGYFILKDFIKPRGWKEVIIVTSAVHKERAQYIFEKIVGDACTLHFIDAPDDPNQDDTKSEEESFKRTRHHMEHIRPGNQEDVEEAYNKHPAYNS